MHRALTALLIALSPLPAVAQAAASDDGAWQTTGDAIKVGIAGIALPQSANGLNLGKSGEISDGGEALDNYAQYTSSDGVIQATAYIYRPGYADAAISAYMTEKAILERFGPTKRTSFGTAAAAGQKDSAIRSVYSAADGELVTAAAFVHAGGWLVKLRVTGPSDRASEVTSGLDGLLAGLSFDDPAQVQRAAANTISACPATAVHQDTLCVREQVKVGEDSYDVLQSADAGPDAQTILVPLDDAGKVMHFERIANGSGYQLMIHQVGRTDIYQNYDRLPDAHQIAAIIDGSDQKSATRIASTAQNTPVR